MNSKLWLIALLHCYCASALAVDSGAEEKSIFAQPLVTTHDGVMRMRLDAQCQDSEGEFLVTFISTAPAQKFSTDWFVYVSSYVNLNFSRHTANSCSGWVTSDVEPTNLLRVTFEEETMKVESVSERFPVMNINTEYELKEFLGN